MKNRLINKIVLKVIINSILILGIFQNCNPKPDTTIEDNLTLLSLLSVANRRTTTTTATRTPTTTCSTVKASPTVMALATAYTNTIIDKELCYFTFTNSTGLTQNFAINLTPISNSDALPSDTDLASISGTSTGGNKPTSSWSGTGANCTPFGWATCLSANQLGTESITWNNVPNNGLFAIGVFGKSCSTLDGCKFSLNVQVP